MIDPNPLLHDARLPVAPRTGAEEPGSRVSAPPRVLLVRGCPRSGTSMLVETINQSPRAGMIFEYSLGQLVRDLEPLLAYGRTHNDLRNKLGGAESAAAANSGVYWNIPTVGPLRRFPTEERFPAIVRAVVEASLDKRDLEVIGSKTPGDIAHGDRASVEPYFPRISYLFTTRSPLDTINSMLNRRNLTQLGVDTWPWTDVEGSIREYRHNVNLLLSHADAYGADCFVVKYEDLNADIDAMVRRLSDYLQIPFAFDTALAPGGYLRRPSSRTKNVMSPDEEAQVRAAFGDAIASWSGKVLTGPAPDVAGELVDCVAPMQVETKYRYDRDYGERHFLGLGWSAVQADGVWTDAARADLFCRVASDGDYALYVEASFYVPEARPTLNVTLDVDGAEAFRGTFVASGAHPIGASSTETRVYPGDGRKGLMCGPLRLRANRVTRLTFTIDDPRSPMELGYSADSRKVAVLLHSLLLTRA